MRPVLQAIILAERIYTDISGQRIICGTLNRLLLRKQELKIEQGEVGASLGSIMTGQALGSVAVYISLVDVVDRTRLSIEIFNLTNHTAGFACDMTIDNQDRLNSVEIITQLPPVTICFPTPGNYCVDLVWKDEVIGSQRLTVEYDAHPNQNGDHS